jgi:hypothetical protein
MGPSYSRVGALNIARRPSPSLRGPISTERIQNGTDVQPNWPPLLLGRAKQQIGAGPVGQPSPDTLTTAVRLAPRQSLVRAVEAVVSGIPSGLFGAD